ncbi:hypothetical protein WJX77_007155 [Trebouxia sp. C0004]
MECCGVAPLEQQQKPPRRKQTRKCKIVHLQPDMATHVVETLLQQCTRCPGPLGTALAAFSASHLAPAASNPLGLLRPTLLHVGLFSEVPQCHPWCCSLVEEALTGVFSHRLMFTA